MERVFADTGYWIALLNPRDDLHQKASATSRDYTPNQIVTSEMVLTEFLNSFSDYGPGLRQAAARAVVSLRDTAQIVIVPQTGQLFKNALKRYQDMADKAGASQIAPVSWSWKRIDSRQRLLTTGISPRLDSRHFCASASQPQSVL